MPTRPSSPPRPAPARRGSIYVLALGASTLVVVAGLSVVAITRAQGRAADAQRDAAEAGLAAQSAIDIATAGMSSDPDWREEFRSGAPIGPLAIGRASVLLYLDDPADEKLAGDAFQPVLATAVARVGGATRALSARLLPAGGVGLDCLRAAVATSGPVDVSGTTSIAAGLLISGGTLTNSAQLAADVQARTVESAGFISGQVTTGIPAPTLPDNDVWDLYAAQATDIPFSGLRLGINRELLTSTNNPYGPVSPSGIYSITVPRKEILRIRRSRLQATLLVSLAPTATLELSEEVNWEPPTPEHPLLIVAAAGESSVTLNLSDSPLSESGQSVNFNPAQSPYNGKSNSDQGDLYPSELRGLIHVLGDQAKTSIQGSTRLTGCLIAESAVILSGTPTLAPLPSLLTAPPPGYAKASGMLMEVEPGSVRWVFEPAGSR